MNQVYLVESNNEIEVAKARLKQARGYVFCITRELDKIDELWHKLFTPKSSRWSLELPSATLDPYHHQIFDKMAEREKAAKELYDFVCVVEAELRQLSKRYPDEAQVLDMHYIERKSYKEISEAMNYCVRHIKNICLSGLSRYSELIQ